MKKITRKRGFTIIELIVVLAIVGVLIAMAFPVLTNKSGDITSANSRAEDFYIAMQSTLMTYDLEEDRVVTYNSGEIRYIDYSDHKNKIDATALYMEAYCTSKGFQYVKIGSTLNAICCPGSAGYISSTTTALGKRIIQDLDKRISTRTSGYYYIVIDSSFRVLSTHFTNTKFEYENDEFDVQGMFIKDGICKGNVVGSCTSVNWEKAKDTAIDYRFLGEYGSYFLQTKEDTISGSFVY